MAVSHQPLKLVEPPKIAAGEQLASRDGGLSGVSRNLDKEAKTALGVTSGPDDRDPYAVTALADITDRSLHAAMARFTGGLSLSLIHI